jgi:hypothetical protein
MRYRAREKIVGKVNNYSRISELKTPDMRVAISLWSLWKWRPTRELPDWRNLSYPMPMTSRKHFMPDTFSPGKIHEKKSAVKPPA